MDVEVTYSWTEKNEMCISYHAVSDEDTLCNLTNHAYFNLSGEENILDHTLQINASLITATDEALIPTGESSTTAHASGGMSSSVMALR